MREPSSERGEGSVMPERGGERGEEGVGQPGLAEPPSRVTRTPGSPGYPSLACEGEGGWC